MKLVVGVLAALLLVEASSGFSVRDPWPSKLRGVRITEGKDALPGQFPYQVSMQWGLPPILPMTHACGGAILNEYWILSAGHCVTTVPKIGKTNVKVGKHHILKDDEFTQTHEIALKIVHEAYPGNVAPFDIALFKLKTPITFNERVQPIRLPVRNTVHTGQAVISGWGSVSKKIIPKLPMILQTAEVPIVPNIECDVAMKALDKSAEIYPTMMCTGPLDGTISTCSGDSGGPLAVRESDDDKPTLVGVVSWGVYPCGAVGAPSVYTRVAAYVDWINKKMSEN